MEPRRGALNVRRVLRRRPGSSIVTAEQLDYESIRTELSALMSVDRRLHASEERKRQILLAQLERYDTKNLWMRCGPRS